MNKGCGGIQVLIREDRCYDMESHRVALSFMNRNKYEYFVFLNCGLVGPMQPIYSHDSYWANQVTKYIDQEVKLVGLSVNCGCFKFICGKPHVQSFLWSTDLTGLNVILQAEAIFDCGHQMGSSARNDAVILYEIGMSQAIIEAGYKIMPTNYVQGLNMTFSLENYRTTPFPENCIDIWHPKAERVHKIKMSPMDSLFWKSTLSVTEQLIQYIALQDQNHASLNPANHLSRKKMMTQGICGKVTLNESAIEKSMWWRKSTNFNTWLWRAER